MCKESMYYYCLLRYSGSSNGSAVEYVIHCLSDTNGLHWGALVQSVVTVLYLHPVCLSPDVMKPW